jgi:hypothetical protein
VNPFFTDADLGRMVAALVSGQAGAHSETLSSGLNPIVQSIIEQITGRSLLTGGALPKNGPKAGLIGNAAYNTVTSLPQIAAIETALGHGKPTKPTSLYQHDLASQVAALLGAPIKKTSLRTAHLDAAKEGKPPR